MEKQFITALLVLLLVAPQTGLEAKGRHHGVKDRDDDSKKHYYKARKHRYSRHRSSHKLYRFARATKAELELLNQAISDVNARIDDLEQGGGELPSNLEGTLNLLRGDIDTNKINIDINKDRHEQNTDDIEGIKEDDIKVIKEDILELFRLIDNLENPPPPLSDAVFSGNFKNGMKPGVPIGRAWDTFINDSATGDFSSIEIKSSDDGGNSFFAGVACTESPKVGELVGALNSFNPGSETTTLQCGGVTWNVGGCGGTVELNAGNSSTDGLTCDCGAQGIVIRPFMSNPNWGGVGSNFGSSYGTCGAPDLTMEVILTR